MYGVVLMMAMSGASEAPDCGCLARLCCRDHYYSTCSCAGYTTCSCQGYATCACQGYSTCACQGYTTCSCYGSTWGHGCSGAYNCGCFGSHSWLGHGCYGSYGCSGCYGSVGCYGCDGGMMVVPPVMQSVPPPGVPTPPPPTNELPMPKGTANRVPGTILVSVPADTVLFFDSARTTVTTGTRRFSTPPLEPGRTYFYTVRAEVVQDGQTVATTRRVLVRSGQEAQVSFDLTPVGTLTAHQD